MTAASIAPAIVVIPSNAPLIRDALHGLDVAIVENPGADEGMASSIRTGVNACDGDVVITLCDQPRVTSAHLAALVTTGAPIAATAYADTLGVPAFFAERFRGELLALRGDRGAKAILAAHRSEVVAIELEAAADDLDVIPGSRRSRHPATSIVDVNPFCIGPDGVSKYATPRSVVGSTTCVRIEPVAVPHIVNVAVSVECGAITTLNCSERLGS
ncbi:MAG: hypothetical protein JWO97_363 [Acidobacteria bacterium]|nr:hypothetical protein [Acidobacteriota bacterium]